MSAKVIMVQGTMSNVGKSLLTAGLLRVFKQDGYRVAPFKSQNMALNSYVDKDGLEMGRAQAVQAQAAGIEPSVLMNPILLKPTSDMGSQVIVNGEVYAQLSARDYFAMKKTLLPAVMQAYNTLSAQNDVIVIEGAGSPAEINLKDADVFVNMGMAKAAKAPVLLVGDIDRGGVFAQLYGTVALLGGGRSFPLRHPFSQKQGGRLMPSAFSVSAPRGAPRRYQSLSQSPQSLSQSLSQSQSEEESQSSSSSQSQPLSQSLSEPLSQSEE